MRRIWIWILIVIIFITFLLSFLRFFNVYGAYRIGDLSHFKEYRSEKGQFIMQISRAWTVHDIAYTPKEHKYLINTMGTSNSKAYININFIDSDLISMYELLNVEESEIFQLDSFTNIQTSSLTLGANDGILREYKYIQESIFGNYVNHCYDWIVKNKSGYFFTFCVDEAIWDNGKPIFQKMIESIEFE